jgi:hypothetical protein
MHAYAQGNIFANHQRVYMILLPYMTVAVMHYCLARWQHGTWVCIPINHLGEVRQWQECQLCATPRTTAGDSELCSCSARLVVCFFLCGR